VGLRDPVGQLRSTAALQRSKAPRVFEKIEFRLSHDVTGYTDVLADNS